MPGIGAIGEEKRAAVYVWKVDEVMGGTQRFIKHAVVP